MPGAEAEVWFVQCTNSYKWDQHEYLKRNHTINAREVKKLRSCTYSS